MSLHAENRARLVAGMRGSDVPARSVIVLKGGEADMRHETGASPCGAMAWDGWSVRFFLLYLARRGGVCIRAPLPFPTHAQPQPQPPTHILPSILPFPRADHENLFRQESFFHWAFGVREPDFFGSIDLDTGASTLFVPRLPATYAIWMGKVRTPEEWKEVYAVDSVRYTDEIADVLLAADPGILYVLHGFNTDGKAYAKQATFPGIEKFRVDNGKLWPIFCELRTVKTEKEIALLRYTCSLTSEAHIAVMQHTIAGHMEYQLESVFHHWCHYHGGCRHMSYTCICASGHNGSILHYGHAGEPNAKRVAKGDLCLFDMGTEFHCYGSDVTTTFPEGGKFTADQLVVYNAVLAATYAVEDAMKPGVSWRDMHTLAYRTILTKLKEGGLLT
jgi:Xaa-Pro dipeptidase